ncbi:hypothetical protein H8E77_37145 [bacterium]|nr:hypothetical protein [bacterium]
MAIPQNNRQEFLPEQAKSKILASLANLSPKALNELVVFVEFLNFREQVMDGLNEESVQSTTKSNYDISEFAGMLSDLTPEEMERFDEAVKRRTLFTDRKMDL